jgi:hypothetical protein
MQRFIEQEVRSIHFSHWHNSEEEPKMKKIKKLFLDERFANESHPIDDDEITNSEAALGIKFPTPLREFWDEFGYAFIRQGFNDPAPIDDTNNRLLSPTEIEGLLKKVNDGGFMAPGEGFKENCIPFFHLGEESYLQVALAKPYAVFSVSHKAFEPSLTAFFDRITDSAKIN